ncbi:MAG: hypothetical protein ABL933_01870 [Methyloglobulus sp.]|nr:hypothetical protein [Methyloglobulus sp.]
MKKTTLRTLLAVSALSIASGYTVLAQAHCIGAQVAAPITVAQFNPSEIVNDSTNALQYDSYTTICPAGSTKMVGRVARIAGPAAGNITLRIVRNTGAGLSTAVSDAAPGVNQCDTNADAISGAGVPSAFTTSAGGAGEYILMVSKDDAGASGTYNVEAHCQDAAGNEFDPNRPSASALIGWDRVFNH